MMLSHLINILTKPENKKTHKKAKKQRPHGDPGTIICRGSGR